MLFRLEISSGEDGCRCLAVCGEGAWHFRNDGASLESFLGSGFWSAAGECCYWSFPRWRLSTAHCSLLNADLFNKPSWSMLHYIFAGGCGRSCLSKYRVLVYAKSANNNNKEYLLFDLCVCVCTMLARRRMSYVLVSRRKGDPFSKPTALPISMFYWATDDTWNLSTI